MLANAAAVRDIKRISLTNSRRQQWMGVRCVVTNRLRLVGYATRIT